MMCNKDCMNIIWQNIQIAFQRKVYGG
jgi:hypothetical protein